MDRSCRAPKPQSDPALEAQLQPGERLLLTTAGHCDCGTALGAHERKAALLERRRRSDERKEASFRRKGWGNPGFRVGATNNRRLVPGMIRRSG
jgi:hypothetical protein